MSTTISPNMNLPIPVVGVEAGPQYATDVNNSLSVIDSHDHSAGKGVRITPDGLNISSDLTFAGHNATTLRTVRYQANPTIVGTDLNATYVNTVDLYYVDGNGNQVRITQNGAVAGTPGSIANLASPASASYVSASSKFVWQSAANTAADLDFRSAILRNSTANSKGLTLSPPTGMASDYSITLPALPVSGSPLMTIDTSGNMGAVVNVDNSSLEISSNVLQVKAGGITRADLVAVGQQISTPNSGTFATSSGSPVDITNMSVSLTTTGRPVMIFIQGDISGGFVPNINVSAGTTTTQGVISFNRSGTDITAMLMFSQGGGDTTQTLYMPPGCFLYLDTPAAGTYTYKAQASTVGGNVLQVNYCKLVAYEL